MSDDEYGDRRRGYRGGPPPPRDYGRRDYDRFVAARKLSFNVNEIQMVASHCSGYGGGYGGGGGGYGPPKRPYGVYDRGPPPPPPKRTRDW